MSPVAARRPSRTTCALCFGWWPDAAKSRPLRSTPESGTRAGHDGAKGKRGSKAHMAVDALGHLLAPHVTYERYATTLAGFQVVASVGYMLQQLTTMIQGVVQGPDRQPRYCYTPASARTIERVREMERLCRSSSIALAAAALRFSMRDPRVASTIVGMSEAQRIVQTERFSATHISDERWSRLEQLITEGRAGV